MDRGREASLGWRRRERARKNHVFRYRRVVVERRGDHSRSGNRDYVEKPHSLNGMGFLIIYIQL